MSKRTLPTRLASKKARLVIENDRKEKVHLLDPHPYHPSLGTGVFATRLIEAGEETRCFYLGINIRHPQGHEPTLSKKEMKDGSRYYMVYVTPTITCVARSADRVKAASGICNDPPDVWYGALINHSKTPNCVFVPGKKDIVQAVALVHILPGEELLADYGDDYVETYADRVGGEACVDLTSLSMKGLFGVD